MHRKGLVIGIFILMLSVNIGSTFAGDVDVKTMSSVGFDGDTLYVGGSGPNNYTKIQDAIDDALDGDTVFVYDDSSPYNEAIEIHNRINLTGENRNTTIINGVNASKVIGITVNNVIINGFTIQNGSSYGILIKANYTIISNNNIIKNDDGIVVRDYFSFNHIFNNNISFNYGSGIFSIGAGIENNIDRNIVSNNGVYGIYIGFFKSIISNNKIFMNGRYGICCRGIDIEICNNEIYFNKEDGISLSGSPVRNCKIHGNNIHNNLYFGINVRCYYWDLGLNIDIIDNNIEYNLIGGIKLYYVFFSEIKNNNIYHNLIKARFITSFCNKWDGNYWGSTSRLFKIISGSVILLDGVLLFPLISFIRFPMYNIDWNPAQEPYDIEV